MPRSEKSLPAISPPASTQSGKPSAYFTTAIFHRPEELADEISRGRFRERPASLPSKELPGVGRGSVRHGMTRPSARN